MVRKRRRAGVRTGYAMLVVLLGVAGSALAQEGVGARIARADELRSADPERSAALVAGLEAEATGLTRERRLQLEYLRAFHLAIYGNRPEEAARQAMSLFHRTDDLDLKFRAGALVARCHAITRDFGEGLRILNQVMALRHDVRDRTTRHGGINTAALLYGELGQYRLALQYADEVLGDEPSPRSRCMASVTQLEARYHLRELPEETDRWAAASSNACRSARRCTPTSSGSRSRGGWWRTVAWSTRWSCCDCTCRRSTRSTTSG